MLPPSATLVNGSTMMARRTSGRAGPRKFPGWPPAGPSDRFIARLHQVWPSADLDSRSLPTSWPPGVLDEKTTAARLKTELPDRAALLDSIASPHPYLHELTVDLFPRLDTPDLLPDFAARPFATGEKPTVALNFDASPAATGDLGLYLKDQVTDPSKHYLVRLFGAGSHPMTPVRLPDDVSVTILGPDGQGTTNPVPVFYGSKSASTLIEVNRGDLAIANLGFVNEGSKRSESVLRVSDGLLALDRCWVKSQAPDEKSPGAAIQFLAAGISPIGPRLGALKRSTDRPIASLRNCWISANTDAIRAEVGRGVVQLENCLVIAGRAAFHLIPAPVLAARLEADLILENCTVADDRYAIYFAADPINLAGVGRPWLVLTRGSVFPRIWREGGSLLGVRSSVFDHGSIFWQSSNDLYEVNRFLADPEASTNSASASADLKRQWVDLWGLMHTRGDRGPDARKIDHILYFLSKDRSRTSRPTLSQMELDPKVHKSQGVNFKNLPPIPRS